MHEKIISRPDQSGTNSCAAIIVAAGSGVRAASASKFTSRQASPFAHDDFGHDDFGLKNFEKDEISSDSTNRNQSFLINRY